MFFYCVYCVLKVVKWCLLYIISYDTANRQTGIASAEADGAKERILQFNRYDGEGLRYETEENGKIIRFVFDWENWHRKSRKKRRTVM